MESLPTEVKDKIIDFKNGDNKYWKNEYNKVMNEINNIKTCVYCKRRFNKVDLLDYIYIYVTKNYVMFVMMNGVLDNISGRGMVKRSGGDLVKTGMMVL